MRPITKENILNDAKAFFIREGFKFTLCRENGEIVGINLSSYTPNGVRIPIYLNGKKVDMTNPKWWKFMFHYWVDDLDIMQNIHYVKDHSRKKDDYLKDQSTWFDEIIRVRKLIWRTF